MSEDVELDLELSNIEERLKFLNAKEFKGRLQRHYFVTDLSTPEKVDAMVRLNFDYISLLVAELRSGEMVPFFYYSGNHDDTAIALLKHHSQLGLPESPVRIFGAQWEIPNKANPVRKTDILYFNFRYPQSDDLRRLPQGERLEHLALATISKIDPSRYTPEIPLKITSFNPLYNKSGYIVYPYTYEGGNSLNSQTP